MSLNFGAKILFKGLFPKNNHHSGHVVVPDRHMPPAPKQRYDLQIFSPKISFLVRAIFTHL
jgi:hypothetical protein